MHFRTATTSALAIAALSVAAAGAAPAKPSPVQGVKVVKCSKAARSAAFSGRMRVVEDTAQMQMRFTLFERLLPGKAYSEVEAPGLAVWHKSDPGVMRFRFRQRVRALTEAAMYRMAVEFRWYDAEGQLIRQAFRRSRRCRQAGQLPNLKVEEIRRRANGRLAVKVRNTGNDTAVGASVQLFVDSTYDAGVLPLREVPAQEARWTAGVQAPPCVNTVQAVADPTFAVREWAEDDNALTVTCLSLASR
jgi:hypothetical protein